MLKLGTNTPSRRAASPIHPVPIVRGDVTIDLAERHVLRADQPVHLSPTEFRLLATLTERPGHITERGFGYCLAE